MKKAIAIIVLGLLWCNVGHTATVEWLKDTYINCEPKEHASEDVKKQIKYIKFNEIEVSWEWDPKEKKFLKKDDLVEIWEVKYIFKLNSQWDGAIWMYDKLEIDRTTGILKYSPTHYDTKNEKYLSLPEVLFQCDEINESDLPKIEVEQKF